MDLFRLNDRERVFRSARELIPNCHALKNLGACAQNDIPLTVQDLDLENVYIDSLIDQLEAYRQILYANVVKSENTYYFYHAESDSVWYSDCQDDLEMNADAALSCPITEAQYIHFQQHGVIDFNAT